MRDLHAAFETYSPNPFSKQPLLQMLPGPLKNTLVHCCGLPSIKPRLHAKDNKIGKLWTTCVTVFISLHEITKGLTEWARKHQTTVNKFKGRLGLSRVMVGLFATSSPQQ